MPEFSREFLEEMWREAKKHLPGWLYASLLQSARPRAGGRASHRTDEPDAFAKLALVEIKPKKLEKISDEDLRSVWLRLNQWHSNAKRRRQAVEDIVNAALWVKAEIEKRGFRVAESALVEDVTALEALNKERRDSVYGKKGQLPKFLEGQLEQCPDEVLLIRDFVSVAGSAAVAEKPGDIDVVIRSEYDSKTGKYGLDGSALWVALRRFMSPDKKGPQIQLIDSPAGSFTDFVPVFDLVARRREPHVVKVEPSPPSYEGRERVVKQAPAAEPSIRAQADKAKRENKLTVGEFFYQPKPTRPAYEEERMSVDGLVKMYEERKSEWLPAWVQKKYDGANHQIHKDGERVVIYSEDGDDNTARLPGIVAAVKKLKPTRLVLPAEIEYWENNQHFPRERVAGYLAQKGEPDDSKLVANIYDVIWSDDKDLHGLPYRERLDVLKTLGGGTMGAPGRRQLNFAPGQEVKSSAEVRSATERIRKLPGSEGVVIKRLDSPYRLDFTAKDDWVKYHNNTLIRGVVSKAYRTKGGAWTYDYSVQPGRESVKLGQDRLVPVGESFATSRRFKSGDKILIEAETVNKIVGPEGVRLTAWVPRVLGDYTEDPDTVDTAVNRAKDELVLQVKRVDEKGDVVEYLPANVLKAELKPEVPTSGPDNAVLAFVGASPGRQEAARREPFVGPGGETLNDVYLKPLGLSRSEVMITNAVPKALTDEQGRTREPTVEEIKDWRDWLDGELERKKPKIVIALGRTAESALGDRTDFTLPHPSAVRRFGDSGEVGRKLRKIKAKLRTISKVEKQIPKPLLKPRAEGGTRSIAAFENWEKAWHDMLPSSGKGHFVYQHHWRGLEEDETKLTDEQLLNTDHSLHGDIRLEGDKALWGFAVLLGRAQDNKAREGGDKLIGWKEGDNIELAPKIDQPKEWLNVGVNKPLITGPGEVGATSEKFSKFFALDEGTYQLGVARQHMIEIFLDGKRLSGRYLFMFAPVAGRRRWLIDKPQDQTPMAERRDLADVISELKKKGQRYLIWAKPGEKPKKIDVRSGRVVKHDLVSICKADPVQRIVYGIVIDPYGENGPQADAHNDWTPPKEVEQTAHRYLKSSRVIGLQHGAKANAEVVESWVEPYPTRQDYLKAMRNEDHSVFRRPFGDDVIHSGAWGLAVKLGEKEWNLYEDGKLNCFSPGGYGIRTPISQGFMPTVKFIELIPKEAANA